MSLLGLPPAFALEPPADKKGSPDGDGVWDDKKPGYGQGGTKTQDAEDSQDSQTDQDTQDAMAMWAAMGLVTRAGWEADESARTWEPEFSPVQVVTVHHSARPVSDRAGGGANEVRAIYDLHARSLAWGDVGYHLLIDPDGVLYEGRRAGEDGEHVPVFGTVSVEGSRPVCVTAGHVRGHNQGNVGVCLLGDFTGDTPTTAALATLEHVLDMLCRAGDLDPLGTVRYVNPTTGVARTARTITSHRDWTATLCPGQTVAGELEGIRRRVARRSH